MQLVYEIYISFLIIRDIVRKKTYIEHNSLYRSYVYFLSEVYSRLSSVECVYCLLFDNLTEPENYLNI